MKDMRTATSFFIIALFMFTVLLVYARKTNEQNQYKFNNRISSLKLNNSLNPIEANKLESRLLNLEGIYKAKYNSMTNTVVFIFDPTVLNHDAVSYQVNLCMASITVSKPTAF